MDITVTRIRHRWAEPAGFSLNRPQGEGEYILLHFLTPVTLRFHGETVCAERGSFIIFSPQTPHCFTSEELLLHDWMHLNGDLSALMAEYSLLPDTLYHPEIPETISDIIAFMEMEFFAQRPHLKTLMQIKLQELLIRIAHSLRNVQPELRLQAETIERLRELRSRIIITPGFSWSVAEMAQAMHLSESRLYAVYRAAFGVSPRHDLILMRVEKAKFLLQGGASVSDTAEQLGYGNVYHFIRQFKQFTGTTPKQYSLKGF